jgi:purine nucleosidase
MELAGSLTRGRTVVETRAGHGAFNAEFAADCDAAAIKAIVLDALLWEAQK